MTNRVASTKRAISPVDRGSNFIVLLIFCLFTSGCQTVSVLTEASLYGCGTSNVYLSGWWASVPDKSVISYDPMGGYLFAYWVDVAGNACHGDPGRNGQVGPAVINASKPQAYESANNESSITEEQLRTFQEIPVSFGNYSGSGLHFVQFINMLKRSRVDGKTDRWDNVFSIPTVMEIGTKSCVAPVAFRLNSLLFLPSASTMATAQDPARCKVRVMPTDTSISEENRKKYHVLDLKHGAEIFSVP
jgi:hypothetical protein